METRIIIENGVVRIELRPENEFEKRLIKDCNKESYNHVDMSATVKDNSHYSYIHDNSEDKLTLRLSHKSHEPTVATP